MRYKQFSFLLLVLILASCNKFLDVKPVDKFLDEQVYGNPATIRNALTGIYLGLAKPAVYGEGLSATTTDVLAQYYNVSKTTDSFYTVARFNYADANSVSRLAAIWKGAYTSILNINLFIYNVEATQGILGVDEKNWMLGEATALRAYVAFDLLRLFGPVYAVDSLKTAIPYPVKPNTDIQPLLPATQVMDSVLADLRLATLLLEKDPVRAEGVLAQSNDNTSNFFRMRNRRMNYFAIKALTARVQLYRRNKVAALAAAKEVIDQGGSYFPWVNPDAIAPGLTAPDRVFSSEILCGLENGSMYTSHALWFKASSNSSRDNLLRPEATNLEIWYDNYPNDSRYRSWFAIDPVSSEPLKTFFKYDGAVRTSYNQFQPLLRISEMYYIAAECTPDETQALSYLNAVLRNRGLPDVSVNNNLQTLIEKEYRKEFWGEGQVFFYYKRMNKTSIPSGLIANGSVTMGNAQYVPPMPLVETEFR